MQPAALNLQRRMLLCCLSTSQGQAVGLSQQFCAGNDRMLGIALPCLCRVALPAHLQSVARVPADKQKEHSLQKACIACP